MLLYVMRHGHAEDRAPTGRDFDRCLTAEGRRLVDRVATELHRGRSRVLPRVLTSPLTRARQTAEVVRAAIDGEPRSGRDSWAVPGWPSIEVKDELRVDAELPLALVRSVAQAGVDALFVGHLPMVEELVRTLLQPDALSLPSGFRTATVVTLELMPSPRGAPARWSQGPILVPSPG